MLLLKQKVGQAMLTGFYLFGDLFSSQTPMFKYEAMLTHTM
jgi:hypothetical protein